MIKEQKFKKCRFRQFISDINHWYGYLTEKEQKKLYKKIDIKQFDNIIICRSKLSVINHNLSVSSNKLLSCNDFIKHVDFESIDIVKLAREFNKNIIETYYIDNEMKANKIYLIVNNKE